MSVYNRKMFKPRNARNALNMSAGIAPVQKFHAGGPVGHTHGIQTRQVPISGFGANTSLSQPVRNSSVTNAQAINAARSASPLLNARMNVLQGRGTAPLRQTMNSGSATINLDPSSLSGIGSVLSRSPQPEQSFREFYGGGLKSMVTNPNPMTVGQQTRSDLAGMAATPVDAVVGGVASGMDAIGDLLSPLTSDELTPGFVAAVVSGKQSLPDSVKQQINNREISVPKALSDALLSGKVDPTGVDLAKLSGFQTSQEVADVVEIMNAAPGSQTIAVEKPVPVGPDGQYDGDDLGNAPTTEPDYGDEFGNIAPDGTMPETTTESTNDTATGGAGDSTGTGDAAPTAKEEIDRVINSGTQEEQQDQLKSLMEEFTENAPEYKGIDKGLALAKIGFAMAAGKSPRAIENIASAMEQGADMLIKDQGKKDEFNRQVKLSALQYGLKDISAERQLQRAAEFQTSDYVLMPGQKYRYPDGRTVTGSKEGTTISLRKSDILENGLPDGVQGTSMATALLTKQAAFDAAIAKAQADGIKSRTLDTPKKITEYVEDYDNSVTDVIKANNAMHLTKQVMIANAEGNITGFQPGFNSMLAKAMTLAGVDATEYTDRDLAIADLRKVFQKLVPLTLGKDQSANSISNQDVNRLADAYMSDAVLSGGVLGLMTTPSNVLDSKLGGILVEFENAQKSALDKLNSLEETGAEFLTPSGSALGTRVSAQRKRLQPFLPQGSRSMLTFGDDGIYRRS